MSLTAADSSVGPRVVLGSGSHYRRELLARIVNDFDVIVPAVNETPLAGEPAAELALRLARAKALAVAERRPAAAVIGSDQVAECAGRILGKPGSAAEANRQLLACSGQVLTLHTAVCLVAPGTRSASPCHRDETTLRFRTLTAAEVAAYVARDRPLDCAGSFRFESLGVVLFDEVHTRDPTAIQGLPLLWLSQALNALGVRIL